MGEAFTAVADDAYAIAYNPAGLGTLERAQFGATYARLLLGLADGSKLGQSNAALGLPLARGRWGALGLAWDQFTLDSAYSERTIAAGYGFRLIDAGFGRVYLGAAVKQLQRGFEPPPEASNAMSGLAATGQKDPLLSGKDSVSTIDADAGLLLRRRSFSLGLAVRHANEPDVAFGSGDKLPRQLRLGAAYKGLWLNVAAEARQQAGPGGKTDREVALAGERFFPTFDFGQLGLRASIAAGTRDFRQATAGLSYRINKIQFDYAFLMPLGTIDGLGGSHRLGVTLQFGEPSAEEAYAEALATQLKRMRHREAIGLGYEAGDVAAAAPLDRPGLEDLKPLAASGRFREAHDLLLAKLRDQPRDPGLLQLARRLDTVVASFQDLSAASSKSELATLRGARAFVEGRDREAVLILSQARSLDTRAEEVRRLLARIEDQTKIRGEIPREGRTVADERHERSEAAYNLDDHITGVQECRDLVLIEPEDSRAWKRLGTNLYLLGRYEEASQSWRKALEFEKDPKERQSIDDYLKKAEKRQPPAPAVPKVKADPRQIESLIQAGIEHYAGGDLAKARTAYEAVLALDPENAQAKKAIERIERGRR